MDTDKKIATFMVGTALLVGLDGLQQGKLSPRMFIGVVIAYLMLLFAASAGLADLAVAFAFLVFLAVLLTRGARVFGLVATASKSLTGGA